MARVHRIDLLGSLAAPVRRADGTMVAEARLTRAGVLVYRNADGTTRREYRPPAEVFRADSLASLLGVPLTNGHPPVMITAENAKQYSVGSVLEPRRDGNYVVARISVIDAETIREMDAGKSKMSSGYDCDLIEQSGVSPEDGERYDYVQTNIEYNHQAIVHNARAGKEAAVRMDAAFNEDGLADPSQENVMDKDEQIRALKLRLDEADKTHGERKDALEAATRERDVALGEIKTMKERVAALEAQIAAGSEAIATEAVTKQAARADAAEESLAGLKATREADIRRACEIRIKAQAVMGPKFRTDGMADRAICAVVIKKFAPQEDVSDKVSDAYLVSRFDSLVEAYVANARGITRVTEVTAPFTPRVETKSAPVNTKDARAKAWREQATNPDGYKPHF